MKKITFIFATILLLGFTSCDLIGNIDDIKQENVLTDQTLITDAQSAEAAVNGVYTCWRTFNMSTIVPSLNVITGVADYANYESSSQFETGNMFTDNAILVKAYQSYYQVIAMANSALAAMENKTIKGLTEQRQKELTADLRFNRAIAHFYLLRLFGEFYKLDSKWGIVITDKPVRENTARPRNSVQACYDFILTDLDYAEKNGVAAPTYHFYASAMAAKALHAKVLMYMGKYAEAAALAHEVNTANGFYKFSTDYMAPFNEGYNSEEVLFSLYTRYPGETYLDMWSAFTVGTKLRKLSVQLGTAAQTEDGMDPRYTKLYTKFVGSNKYPFSSYKAGQTNTVFFLRMTELYYIEAECNLRSATGDKTRARELLQTLVSRAGFANDYISKITDDKLLEELRLQKFMDLHCEYNEELFDFYRYHHAGNLNMLDEKYTTLKKLFLPIPRAARAGNKALEQNPGYED